ncbi:uncharacterized protein SCHCODRAFT_02679160 [Schizophyllum commune H4-8]|uniref:Expressed protein n=1 Tax=Schizophyllum commune (strain H4-8 / FGSC 9210) TaxID=578458 RepID=D8QAM5_SCHCM|nr:uncharacterized protein SCHCODRAFT_02679160 [Schizophyllum commune H4-8]KAI5889928.1 hypothetical protein SCHCODRAFT_02679160 [Schizophyllum commune H4-8]
MSQLTISALEHNVTALSISDATSSAELRSAADEDDVLSCADALMRIAESNTSVLTQASLDGLDSLAASTSTSSHHPSGTSDSPVPSTPDDSVQNLSSPSASLAPPTATASRRARGPWQDPLHPQNAFHYYRSLLISLRRAYDAGAQAQREDEQGIKEADDAQIPTGDDPCAKATDSTSASSKRALEVSRDARKIWRPMSGEEKMYHDQAADPSQTFIMQMGHTSTAVPCFQPM